MSDQISKDNFKNPKPKKSTSTVTESNEPSPSPSSSQKSHDTSSSQFSLGSSAESEKTTSKSRKRLNKKRKSTKRDEQLNVNSDEYLPPRLRGEPKPVQTVFLPNFSDIEETENETCSDTGEISSDSTRKRVDTDSSSNEKDLISHLTSESKSMYSLFLPYKHNLTDIVEEDDNFECERTQTVYLALTNFQNPNDPTSGGSGSGGNVQNTDDADLDDVNENAAPSPPSSSSSESESTNKTNQLPINDELSTTDDNAMDNPERDRDRERSKRRKKPRPKKQSSSSSDNSIKVAKPSRVRIGGASKHQLRIDDSMDSTDTKLSRLSRDMASKLFTNLHAGNAFVFMIIPPDGGFGWVILFFSFLAQVVVDGLIFSIGILMPYIADDLMVKKSEVVLMVSIQIGPVASASINKFGFRPVALTGSVLSSIFIFIATFCPNLPTLIIFYSILGGPSLSMIWISSQLIIGYYFEKYRPIANGISVSGAGVGVVVGAALNNAMAPKYGWRNTLRIHGCLLSSVFLMGLSYIEVAPTKIGYVIESEGESESEENEMTMRTMRYSAAVSRVVSTVSGFDPKELGEIISEFKMRTGFWQKLYSTICPCLAKRYETQSSVGTGHQPKNYLIQPQLMDRQDFYYTGPAEYDRTRTSAHPYRSVAVDTHDRSVNYTLSMMHETDHSHDRHKSYVELKKTERNPFLKFISPLNWLPRKMAHAFSLLFDFRLLAVSQFQILLASAFFFPMGFNIPFVYSSARAKIPDEYRGMISPAIGMSNFFFRILSGFLAYRFKDYTTYICGSGIVLGGTIVFVSAFYGDSVIWFQFVYAVIYGVAPAFYSTLRAIIYVRALGLEKLTNAFGLTGMAMGLGVFVGTTLAGIFNEFTGTHSAAFAFSGCCMITAGSLKLILPTFIKWQEKRLQKKLAKNKKNRTRI